ncbi:MAG: N-acetyltransferase [Gammaproteobacteria bacterium]|nr:MAG: N-acetyltransferase [Gammaproteobacteria bacterium]
MWSITDVVDWVFHGTHGGTGSYQAEVNELLLWQAQNALGFCQIYPSFCSVIGAPIYVLYDLFVSPNVRKSGIGRLLLEQARLHAKENNIPRMDLTTAKTNLTAQSLYESLGWERDDIYFAYNKSV